MLFFFTATSAAAILSRVSEHKLQKCLSMELTNSLFSEDQNLWPSGDLGIAPDLQVCIFNPSSLIVCKYLVKYYSKVIIYSSPSTYRKLSNW